MKARSQSNYVTVDIARVLYREFFSPNNKPYVNHL